MKFFTGCLVFWFIATGYVAGPPDSKIAVKNPFTAIVNGDLFPADNERLSVMLVNQPASIDGRRPSRRIISIIQNGHSYLTSDNRLFNETIQFEINFEEVMPAEPSVYTVSLQYQSVVYSVIKEPGDIKIAWFEWEPDRKHFHISVDFDCTMRSWGYPMDKHPDVRLQGQISDVTIAASPSCSIAAGPNF